MPGQSDIMQARWGSHGDYAIVAYAPASPQEMFDLTIRSFNIADRYRVPVLLMADEVVGHMVERVEIPSKEEIEYWQRKQPDDVSGAAVSPFMVNDPDLVPPMIHAGDGYKVHFTGLTHDERGYPDMSAETHDKLVKRLIDKVKRNRSDIIMTEGFYLEDAEIVVVSYGCTARSARHAVREAREQGIQVGMLRLISIWPFPFDVFQELINGIEKFIVAEMNLGQISLEVERCVKHPVKGVYHAGGRMIPPEPILEAILEVAE
jgi:2-oxoglutarate ferredoxin oxidoreductase subunit alpha